MANMDTGNDCFCELAPLYALGLLGETEQAWVEQQVTDCPDLAEELADYTLAVTAVPYGVPVLPLASNLKHQLFNRLGLDAPVVELPPNLVGIPHQAVRSQDLDWQPYRVPGVMVAIVHIDPVKREVVGFLRAEPGVHYPYHRHAAIEEIFMTEGDLVIGDAVYGAGDYIRSASGSSHAPYTNGGCCFFFHSSMDNEYPEVAVTV